MGKDIKIHINTDDLANGRYALSIEIDGQVVFESTENTTAKVVGNPTTPTPKKRVSDDVPYDDIVKLYNEICTPTLPKAEKLTRDRKQNISARWHDYPDLEKFKTVFRNLVGSPWCTGSNDRGWKADFNFAIAPTKFPRLLEGFYGNKSKEKEEPKKSFDANSFFASAIRRTAEAREKANNG